MSPRPEVSEGAEELYRRLGPLTRLDEANDWYVLHRCEAFSRMMQGLDRIVLDTPTHPGWTTIVDPVAAPEAWLSWLSKAIYGVTLVPGADVQEQRDSIRELPPQKRGGVDALISAVKQTQTGAKTVNLFERAGSAYAELIVTDLADTPDPALTLAAVRAQKIGGVKQIYVATSTWLVAEVERTFKTVAEFEAAFETVKAVEEHGVI